MTDLLSPDPSVTDPGPPTPPPPTSVRRGRPGRRKRGAIATLRVIIVTIVLLAACLVWVYPFIWNLSASIKSNTEIFEGLNPFAKVVRLDNYVRAWTDGHMGRYFLNTLFITFFSIIISVTSTALIGYVLGRYSFPGKRIVIGLFVATVFLPEGYTIIPVFDIITKLHLDNSLWGITLAEAARVDGAGFLRTFWQVYLPLARPVTATAIILQFMGSWNSFLLPLVLTLSRPDLHPGGRHLFLPGRELQRLRGHGSGVHHRPGPDHRGVLVPAALLRGERGRRDEGLILDPMQSPVLRSTHAGCVPQPSRRLR